MNQNTKKANQQSHPIVRSTHWVGIDISKRELQIHCCSLKLPAILPFDAKGLKRLVGALSGNENIHVVFEATGGYERKLLLCLQLEEITCSRLNAGHVRHFAKSRGLLAKTDKIDAAIIAEFGRVNTPQPTRVINKSLSELHAAIAYRRRLGEELRREKALLEHDQPKSITTIINARLRSLKAATAKVEALIVSLLEKSPKLNETVRAMSQVKGVGTLTAASFLAAVPELGDLTRNQAAALTGLAPFNNDSGASRGRRSVYGGRAEARKSLYMAAVTAARYNPTLKAFYQKLIQNGKPAKVAITAVMRKLAILLNSIARKTLYTNHEKSAITS
jgi:transposase